MIVNIVDGLVQRLNSETKGATPEITYTIELLKPTIQETSQSQTLVLLANNRPVYRSVISYQKNEDSTQLNFQRSLEQSLYLTLLSGIFNYGVQSALQTLKQKDGEHSIHS